MIKLALNFDAHLDIGDVFTQMAAVSKIMPFEGGRAIVFGWGTESSNRSPDAQRYWLAEVTHQGVHTRVLPTELTYASERPQVASPHAFQIDEHFGLLLSPEVLLLFTGLHDDPLRIRIDHHFSGLGELAHASHTTDSHYQIVHCGHGTGSFVPVVLAAPSGRGAGRHLCLLEVDAGLGRARWLHTRVDGSPRTLVAQEYAGFDESGQLHSVAQIDPTAQCPVVTDCGWSDKHWLVYAAGFNKNFVRFGIPLGVLTRNLVDLSLLEPVFRAGEPSHATICASLDRIIVSPLHKNGPKHGKQTIVVLDDVQEHAVTLPRGYSKHHVLEHGGGTYWLAPHPMGYNCAPVTLTACRAT